MIARLDGRVVERAPDHVVVDVQGVGYKVFVARQPEIDRVRLFIHHAVREDAQLLYGFESREELTLFEMLIGVSNVGPKAAISLLSVSRPPELAAALATGDVAALARAPGVGKKTAERLIVELKGKVQRVAGALPGVLPAGEDEALAALLALGYSSTEALRALRDAPRDGSTAERVQAALRAMAR